MSACCPPIDRDDFARKVWGRLEAGVATAAARYSVASDGTRIEYLVIPSKWFGLEASLSRPGFWSTGDREIWNKGRVEGFLDQGEHVASLFDVRLDPASADELVPKLPKQAAVSSSMKGGRPAKAWWDALWVEMARQLYAGDLQPQRQVDIERAMSDWLVSNNHDASEMTVRTAAKKLFEALAIEDRN